MIPLLSFSFSLLSDETYLFSQHSVFPFLQFLLLLDLFLTLKLQLKATTFFTYSSGALGAITSPVHFALVRERESYIFVAKHSNRYMYHLCQQSNTLYLCHWQKNLNFSIQIYATGHIINPYTHTHKCLNQKKNKTEERKKNQNK